MKAKIRILTMLSVFVMCFFLAASAFAATKYTYYSNKRVESATYDSPNQYGFVYYHFMNESWNGLSVGRPDKMVRKTADTRYGSKSFTITYYGNTMRYKEMKCYSDDKWKYLKMTCTYYNNSTNRWAEQKLAQKDQFGMKSYKLIDEDWKGRGYGRVSEARGAGYDDDGAIVYKYTYWAGTDIVKNKKCYDGSGNLVANCEYNSSGKMTKKVLAPPMVLPWNFIGPLLPNQIRADPPPGTKEYDIMMAFKKSAAKSGSTSSIKGEMPANLSVPADFVGPLPQGVSRSSELVGPKTNKLK